MNYKKGLKLFEATVATETGRPDLHATMLTMARTHEALIQATSDEIYVTLMEEKRIWMTSDLHFGHKNIISYCNRPFVDVLQMNRFLLNQLTKIPEHELLIIVGDLAMGDHDEAMQWIRDIPCRKILVMGNHDLKRNGSCLYPDERDGDGKLVFEAVVPFLCWSQHRGIDAFVSHYPVPKDYALPLVNYHGHLHRDVLPATEYVHYANVGWDVNHALVCL